jgi:hypothetical protein
MDMIEKILEVYGDISTEEEFVLCPLDHPTTVAHFNVYEKGDIWVKIKGCESCPWESRQICCRGCPMNTELGCYLHIRSGSRNKPYGCMTASSSPNCNQTYCYLEFKCIKGKHEGKIRKVKEPSNVFRD